MLSTVDLPGIPDLELGHALFDRAMPGTPADLEATPELKWPDSVPVFEKMRRTDGQIAAGLRAIGLRSQRLKWRLDPNGADPRVVAFITDSTGIPLQGDDATTSGRGRLRGRFQIEDHRRLARLMLVYGHMPFEQVYRQVDDSRVPGGRGWMLRKLAPRMPATLEAINVAPDGGLVSIRQKPVPHGEPSDTDVVGGLTFNSADGVDGEPKVIPVGQLLFYVHEREGGAWHGTSLLRPVYKDWLLKDRLLRVMVATDERNGMGVPWIEAQEGATDADIERFSQLAQAFRAGQTAGGAGPKGSKLSLVGVSGTLPAVLEDIRYLDSQISQNLLTQWLRLGGETNSGNRALGQTFLEMFQDAVNAQETYLAQTFTAHEIEDQVDYNFGADEAAPQVVLDPVDPPDALNAAEVVQLVQAGVVVGDAELDSWVRRRFGLPPRPEGVPDELTLDPDAVADALEQERSDDDERVAASTGFSSPRRRDLNGPEQAARFSADDAERSLDAATERLRLAFTGPRRTLTDQLVEQVAAATGVDDAADLDPDVDAAELVAVLSAAMLAAAGDGLAAARNEAALQGVTVSADLPDGRLITDGSRALATMLAAGLAGSAARFAVRRFGERDLAAQTRAHLDGLVGRDFDDLLAGAIIAGWNAGRFALFASAPQASYFASEVLDRKTCGPCGSVDGIEFVSLDDAMAAYPFGAYADCKGGYRCRGTVVAVYG